MPLQEITAACNRLQINYFIVGAIARNIWLASNEEKPSGTKDIDLAVFVSRVEIYNDLRNILADEYGYRLISGNAFCLLTPTGQQVDLLPFGEIEDSEEVSIQGVGLTTINLEGFKEVFARGTLPVKIGQDTYRSCSIAGIVILKMIAYDDRPEYRMKDVEDISSICNHYPIIEDENIWATHSDLYDTGKKHEDISMVVLGREMNTLIGENTSLRGRISQIIQNAIDMHSQFIFLMIKNPEKETVDQKRNILKNIMRGVTDERTV